MLLYTQAQQEMILNNRRAAAMNAQHLLESLGGQTGGLMGNAATLPRDVWGQWDREAVQIQRDILAVFADLSASVSVPVPIGKLVSYFQRISDSGEVGVSLDGKSNAKMDAPTRDYQGTPLPILDTSFSFGWREVEAASTEGFNLDPAARDNANRRIAEKLEDGVLNGFNEIVVGDAASYGLRNHPQRGTRATGVALNGATGPEWVAEVTALAKVLHDRNFRVPFTLYLNFDDAFYASNTDYSIQYPNKTIMGRVREIDGVGEVVVASRVPANEMIAVVKRRDVIRILNGMPQSTTQKTRNNPMDDYVFMVMAAAVPQILFDFEDQCGVAHAA